ncbi:MULTISPECIES: WPE palindromic element domain-containing protein [unclassified Wolbachia]|uniref:WPE palindromic element domain-containing protein n=1 Tax=unclassified Wolbachia TaxID=2640676 RepID=UPI002231EA3A|nr:WPE palindromic element domain-containing protein [Wolbachia endosymbiont (group A) of Apoderus coryli]
MLKDVIPVPSSCHPSAWHWDPEDLISTKWLHNKGWIPVPSTGMTAIYVIPSRYFLAANK